MATNELLPTASLQLKEGRFNGAPTDAKIPWQVDPAADQRKLLIETAGAVGNFLNKVNETRKGLEVQKAVNEYHKELNQIQQDYKLQKGNNAVNGYESFQKSVEDLGKKYQNFFSDSKMQSAFEQASMGLQTSAQMEGSNWYASNVWQVDYDQKSAAKTLAQNDFVINFNSPMESGYYTSYLGTVAQLARLDGKDTDPKELQAYVQNDIDDLVKAAVSYQIDVQNLGGAAAGLERYKSKISGKTYVALKAEIYQKQVFWQEHNERMATMRKQREAAEAQRGLALLQKDITERTSPLSNAQIIAIKDPSSSEHQAAVKKVIVNNPNDSKEQILRKVDAELDNMIAWENDQRTKMNSAERNIHESIRGYLDAARFESANNGNGYIDTDDLLKCLPDDVRENALQIYGSVEKLTEEMGKIFDMGTYGVNVNAGKYLNGLGDAEFYQLMQEDPDFVNFQQEHGAFTIEQIQKNKARVRSVQEKLQNGELIKSDPTLNNISKNLKVFTGGMSLKRDDPKSLLNNAAVNNATLKLKAQAVQYAKDTGISLADATYQITKNYSESAEWKQELNFNTQVLDVIDDCYEEHESEFDEDVPQWQIKTIMGKLVLNKRVGFNIPDTDELMKYVYEYNSKAHLGNKILAPVEDRSRKNSLSGLSISERGRLKTTNAVAPMKTTPYR